MNRQRPKSGDVVVERYLLLDRLSDAGAGAAFRAVHLATERTVVLQYLVPASFTGGAVGPRGRGEEGAWRPLASHEVTSLMNRVRLLARINHPALVPIQDADVDQGWPFVVRGLIHGQSLAVQLCSSQRPSARELITWMLMVCSGLMAARSVGVVHRDLRPENILLAKNARESRLTPYLVDFGLAHLSDVVDPNDLLSPQRGPYRAPERMQPNHGYKEPGDVYALAAILHEGLTGRLATPVTRMRAALDDWPSNLAIELAEVVMRCLAVQPARRLATLSDLSGALSSFFVDGGTLALPPPATEPRALSEGVGGAAKAANKTSEVGEPLTVAEDGGTPVVATSTTPGARTGSAGRESTRRVKRERRVIQSIRRSSAPPPTVRDERDDDELLDVDGGGGLSMGHGLAKHRDEYAGNDRGATDGGAADDRAERTSATAKVGLMAPGRFTMPVAQRLRSLSFFSRTSPVGALGVLSAGERTVLRLPSGRAIVIAALAAVSLLFLAYVVALHYGASAELQTPTLLAP